MNGERVFAAPEFLMSTSFMNVSWFAESETVKTKSAAVAINDKFSFFIRSPGIYFIIVRRLENLFLLPEPAGSASIRAIYVPAVTYLPLLSLPSQLMSS